MSLKSRTRNFLNYLHGDYSVGQDLIKVINNIFNSRDEKVSPVSDDLLVIEDSENSFKKKKLKVGNLPGAGGGVYLGVSESVGTTTNAGFVLISVPTAHIDKKLHVVITNSSNLNRTVGIRQVGSVVSREFLTHKDDSLTMTVKTDASGNFEIKSDGSSDVSFIIITIE